MVTHGRGSRRWLRIAVVLDASRPSLWALHEAVAAAKTSGGCLTLITLGPRPWPTLWHGTDVLTMHNEMLALAGEAARKLTRSLPAGLPCVSHARCGGAESVLEILRAHPHDAVFLARPRHDLGRQLSGRRTSRRLQRLGCDVVVLSERHGDRPVAAAGLSFDEDAGLPGAVLHRPIALN